jgi:hypothetical protein
MNISLKDIGINSTKLYKERHEQICLIKRFNGLNFVTCLNKTNEGQPNSIGVLIQKPGATQAKGYVLLH